MKILIKALGVCMWILLISSFAFSQESASEGTTKKGVFGCKTQAVMAEAHSALQAMEFDHVRSFYQAGDCWHVDPGKKAMIVTEGEWGSPIQVRLEGRTFWLMQHMLRYSSEKENENDLCKVLFAAGVGAECGWAPKKNIAAKLMDVSNFAVRELGVSSDRLVELQTLHIPAGKSFVAEHGCSHPYIRMMKGQFGKFFSAQQKQ